MNTTTFSVAAFSLAALSLAGGLSAQRIAATITPNPAAVGAPITVTVNDASGSGFFYNGSAWWSIRQGSPSGPVVGPPLGISLPFIGNSGPYGSLNPVTWNQGDLNNNPVGPGTYYFEVQGTGEFFPITIIDPATSTRPALTVNGTLTPGANVPLSLSSPTDAGATYLVYWSRSSNNPIKVPGLDIQLDNPFFGDYITGWAGTLDVNGDAFPGPIMNIPNLPQVQFQGLTAQAVVLPLGGGIKTSNGLPMRVQ